MNVVRRNKPDVRSQRYEARNKKPEVRISIPKYASI
jgi:hypothetical protein